MIFAHMFIPARPISLFVLLTILFCILFWLFFQCLNARKVGYAILVAPFLAIVFLLDLYSFFALIYWLISFPALLF